MTDMTATIIAKSDQLNSDDLIGRNITIEITKISLAGAEQPISINYKGDEGKPWKPCKSMRRILVGVWGKDGNLYIGRSLTLYRDDSVMFGGQMVGGIRISHMSHLEKPITMSLSATKKSKKLFMIQPLVLEGISFEDRLEEINRASSLEELQFKFSAAYKLFPEKREDLVNAKDTRKLEFSRQKEQL